MLWVIAANDFSYGGIPTTANLPYYLKEQTMYDPSQHVSTKNIPQTERTPGREDEVENHAGGFVFEVDIWTQLRRFLILGTEGGTYYVSERKQTQKAAGSVIKCIKADGQRVVKEVVEVSQGGRAPKNDPALFVLAMCTNPEWADKDTRRAAFRALPDVARIGTHLFHFAQYMEAFRGWGRLAREAVANWYNSMPLEKLTYQAVKYRQRDGWSHRDLLRLAHPATGDEERNALYKWITKGQIETVHGSMRIVGGYQKAQKAETVKEVVETITEYNLPRECVPTQFLKAPEVWEALLHSGRGMPFNALVRNLGNLSKCGLLKPMSETETHILKIMADTETIKGSRIHPIQALAASATYGEGHGLRGKGEWTPCPKIVDALEDVFYMAFDNVEPTGKRHLLGIDVSGSMASTGWGWGETITMQGVGGITPAMCAAALAMVTLRTEPSHYAMGFATSFRDLQLTPRMRLQEVMAITSSMNFGRTDCALPMVWAKDNRIEVDTFIVYTDNETWAGRVKPNIALQLYRNEMGIDARLIVVGMTATEFSIADPTDAGMMDVVGMDTSVPNMIRQFTLGQI